MSDMFDDILNSPVSVSMRHNLVTISPSEPVSSLTYRMVEEDIGAVIVVDKKRPIGIITEKDILDRVVVPGEDVYTTRADEVMSEPVISIEASSPLEEALELMRENGIRRLAVVEDGVLVGLVTERRLLARIANSII